MIPVAANHASNVVNGDVLPCLVADMLPSGNFFKHQQADFVATIQEMARLRIVRRAHDVAMQTVAEDFRVLSLNACRHRLAHERKRLMTGPIPNREIADRLRLQLSLLTGERP